MTPDTLTGLSVLRNIWTALVVLFAIATVALAGPNILSDMEIDE